MSYFKWQLEKGAARAADATVRAPGRAVKGILKTEVKTGRSLTRETVAGARDFAKASPRGKAGRLVFMGVFMGVFLLIAHEPVVAVVAFAVAAVAIVYLVRPLFAKSGI